MGIVFIGKDEAGEVGGAGMGIFNSGMGGLDKFVGFGGFAGDSSGGATSGLAFAIGTKEFYEVVGT